MKKILTKKHLTQLTLLFFAIFVNATIVFAVNEPDAVQDLTASSDNGQITLSWTEPNDNGSAITGYTVEYGTVASGLFNNTCVTASCTDATPGANITGLTNWTEYQIRISAINGNGTGPASNVATTVPTLCGPLADNDDSGGPTVSEACIGVTITAGTISFEDVPDSFSFPNRFSSSFPQDSFSNDDPGTGIVDVESETDDILTISDLRNSGGFDVTITSSTFTNSTSDEIPLENLYIATSCPDGDDLTADLYGSPTNCDNTIGVEFADGSTDIANMNQASTVHSDSVNGTASNASQLTALINAYTTDGANFDANLDDTPDTITLMESTSARLARISQALNFYLSLPANQESGTYNVLFTIDLLPN